MSSEPRERILGAAAREVAEHGYHGMSMRGLARGAGMSLSNLYNYFPSKEEILYALQKEAFEVLVGSAEEALDRLDQEAGAGGATADSQLYVFVSHHVRYVAERPDVMRVLVHEAASLPPVRRRAVRRLKERYFRIARAIVGRLVAEEPCGGAPTGEAELERATYHLFGMLNWIYGWYVPERHGSPRDLARSIHRIALCGLVAHGAHQDRHEGLDDRLAAMAWPPLLGSSHLGQIGDHTP